MSANNPIRLGLVGTGIFARDAYLPALQSLGTTFEITAVYSRHLENAEAITAKLTHAANAYDDLDALLDDDHVEAVALLLPIHVMPDAIEQALAAGKHVISEKPAAPDVATGRKLLDLYHQHHADQVWMVAENWRYDPALSHAVEMVRSQEVGAPLICHWPQYIDVSPDNKYYQTEWRRSGAFPGGFLLDGGVHHVAGLRLILGEIASVSAVTTQMRPDLPPADTLNAALEFDSGLTGTYSVTYAHGAPWPSALYVVCERGALRVQPGEVEITAEDGVCRVERANYVGVERELAAFATAIREGTSHDNTPEAGLQDVAVIEAMLRSAETGQRIAPERFV